MKVNIGPYRNYWTTSSVENLWIKLRYPGKNYWDVDLEEGDFLDRTIEKFLDMWQSVLNGTINKLPYERKINIHIDNYDVWNMDHTLALIIVPMLKKLKECKQGAPMVDAKDVPKHLRTTENPELNTADTTQERWDWVLDEMIWAFEGHASEDDSSQFHYNSEQLELEFTDSEFEGHKTLQINKQKDTSKPAYFYDIEAHKAHSKRKANGRRLFAKYYEGLWD